MQGFKITLEAARVNAGLTQREAAEKVGVTADTIRNWERNPSVVSMGSFATLCDVYKCPQDAIFLG